MLVSQYLLSALIFVPIVSGLLIFTQAPKLKPSSLKILAALILLIGSSITFCLYTNFNLQSFALQFVEHYAWIPSINVHYHLGLDGISLPLLMLTQLITLITILAAFSSVKHKLPEYLALIFLTQGIINGIFLAMDAILFYIFWEAILIPMYLLIGMYGGKNKVYASFKFFLYTFLGSIFLIIAALILHQFTRSSLNPLGSFNLLDWQGLNLPLGTQKYLFWALLIAFAVKIPMWPVHTWLPDVHVEAPTGGSVILAAIMLKLGVYGLLRFVLPITPIAALIYTPYVIGLSLVAIAYVGLIALVQKDLKKLVAYSSISHMGLVTLGLFSSLALISKTSSSALLGLDGAAVQMVSHGLVSAGLFLCIGVLYDQSHTRLIKDFGGLAKIMPRFAVLFMFFALSNIGLPGTSGFVAELLVIVSAFEYNIWVAGLASSTLLLSAAYTLWMFKRVVFGEANHGARYDLKDLNPIELFNLSLLASLGLGLGLYPEFLLRIMRASHQHLINDVICSKLFS